MSTGHYGPLIVAWSSDYPTPGKVIKVTRRNDPEHPQHILIVREATLEEYLACVHEREIEYHPRPTDRFFEVHTD